MNKTISSLLITGAMSFVITACNDLGSISSEGANESASSIVTVPSANQYEIEALAKVSKLESLIAEATAKNIDITREETVIWFAKEFIKFANWDESNRDSVAYMFEQYAPYKESKDKMADELPDFERKKVIEILDVGIEELSDVISGEIIRRPVNKVDWQNIVVADNMLLSNGKPIFLYDYFSKSVGRPLTDTKVYNDHLGAIFHGGENLYPVDHDRAINSFLLKEDGTFDEVLLREVTDISDTNVGFLIYWNMGVPNWIEKREPEVRKGRSLFTGYDIDNPLIRKTWGKIARETGALTKNKKVSQLGYILANEPHWYSESDHWTQGFDEMQEISSYTLIKFQQWLDKKYNGQISQLNSNWGKNFTNFDNVEIQIPINRSSRGTPIWYDWARFNMYRSVDWFTYLQSELYKGNPSADTHIKIMPNMHTENNRSHGIDTESLVELTTMIGDDAKTRETRLLNQKKPEKWESHYAYFWEELSMSYDFMESVGPNKIHINSESHFLSSSWWRKLDTSVDYVESVYWLATLQGMDANMAWFWARDPDGSPEDRLEGTLNFFDPALAGSFAGSVNQQPHIANAYTQVMYDLNSFSEEIIALRKQPRPLRLFHSETSAINKPYHMTEQFNMYEKLFFDGFPLGFATKNIIKNQDNKLWNAILVYRTEFVTESEIKALQAYLNEGGTVIVDSEKSLSKNEYGQFHQLTLSETNGKLVILKNDENIDQIRDVALNLVSENLPDISLIEDNGTAHKGSTWRVVKQENDSYLVSILNIGKNKTNISISLKDDKAISVVNMLTGKTIDSKFELKSKGVSLLEVKRH